MAAGCGCLEPDAPLASLLRSKPSSCGHLAVLGEGDRDGVIGPAGNDDDVLVLAHADLADEGEQHVASGFGGESAPGRGEVADELRAGGGGLGFCEFLKP